jgi:hypothetical protein
MTSSLLWSMGVLLWLIPAMLLVVIVHELGHALAGTIAGFRIFICGIGMTQPLAQIRIGTVSFYLARPIFMGLTLAMPKQLRVNRFALAVLLAGGAVANLATGLVAWLVWRHVADWKFLAVFATLSFFSGIGNLLPFHSSKYGIASDGMQILRCIRNTLAQEPAQALASSERLFALCKSLNAEHGTAHLGRALALQSLSMGDLQTAEEVLADSSLPTAEPRSLAHHLESLTRATFAVEKKAPNAEEIVAEAIRSCTDEDASLILKLLLVEIRIHAGDEPRQMIEEVLTITRRMERHAITTEAEALLVLMNCSATPSSEYERLLGLSDARRLHPMTALKLIAARAKFLVSQGSTEEAQKLVARGHQLLTKTVNDVATPAIRARILEAGNARLRDAIPTADYLRVLETSNHRPLETKKSGTRLLRVALVVLLYLTVGQAYLIWRLVEPDDEPPPQAERDKRRQDIYDTHAASKIQDRLDAVLGARKGNPDRAIALLERDVEWAVMDSEFGRASKERHELLVKALDAVREYRKTYPGSMVDPDVNAILTDKPVVDQPMNHEMR